MMINNNYAEQVAKAKLNNVSLVNFEKSVPPVEAISGAKDKLTLSDQALAMMSGKEHQEVAPTYVKPETARSLLAANESSEVEAQQLKKSDERFKGFCAHPLEMNLKVIY